MKTSLVSILCVFCVCSTFAQTEKDSLPGNPSLASSTEELALLADEEKGKFTYSVPDYFQRPKQSSFQFSPNGLYFSYREKDDEGKRHVYEKIQKQEK